MSDKISELIKHPKLENTKTTNVYEIDETDLGVGGTEGNKLNIRFELKNTLGKREIKLISKKIKHFKGREAPDVVNAFDAAKKDGFLTANTVRLAKAGDDDVLLMSDMTEGGKYILWGYNDHSTDQETKAFYDLKLTDKDKKEIRDQGNNFIKKANSLDRSLWFYNFHIRRDKDTGKIELLLLDLDPHYFNTPHSSVMNEENFNRFFRLLNLDPSEHGGSL